MKNKMSISLIKSIIFTILLLNTLVFIKSKNEIDELENNFLTDPNKNDKSNTKGRINYF